MATCPKKYKQGSIATYAIHLGEIAPDIPVFRFSEKMNIEHEAERLAEEIVKHGLPWMRDKANYETLLTLLKPRIERLGGNPESYVSTLYYMHDFKAAKDFIHHRADIFDPEDEDSDSNYNKFAKPFLELLENQSLV